MGNVSQFKLVDFITEMSLGFNLQDGEVPRVFKKERYGHGCTFGKAFGNRIGNELAESEARSHQGGLHGTQAEGHEYLNQGGDNKGEM